MINTFYALEIGFVLIWIYLFLLSLNDLPKQKTSKEHIKFFDYIKGYAILAIVLIHAISFLGVYAWLHDILWAAIPIFVIASGYLLSHRHEGPVSKKYWLHIFSRIFMVYFVFSLFFTLIQGWNGLLSFLADLFLGRTMGNYYFIPLIMLLYVVFPLLNKYKKYFTNYLFQALIYLVSFGFFLLDYYLQKPYWNSEPLSLIFPARFLWFFVIGIFLSTYDWKKINFFNIRYPLMFFVIGAILFSFWADKIYFTYIFPAVIFLAFVALYNKVSIHSTWLQSLGKHTLVIYLVHTWILFEFVGPLILTSNSTTILNIISITLASALLSHFAAIIFDIAYNKLLCKQI